MKNVAAVLFAAILACCAYWNAPAAAGEINLSTLTCKQFQSANKDDVGVILAWLDGYYRAEDDPPIIDRGKFATNAKKLGDYCAVHPDTPLITAADTLFERE